MVGPGKILVVDDDPGNREVLEELLRIRVYPVITAASGPEALEVARQELPDLVLLDVTMPGMSGTPPSGASATSRRGSAPRPRAARSSSRTGWPP